ncbi:MAG: hypothetical protein N2689_00845 [Verrucomicrobiae bacterium]|nr:hypothetical protein [Verrucomicrobiae bacterium]
MSGRTKLRGHYVKLMHQHKCVFTVAQPLDLESGTETYLAEIEKSKKPTKRE